MAPNSSDVPETGVLYEEDAIPEEIPAEKLQAKEPFKAELVWPNVLFMVSLHLGSLYGIYLMFTSAKIATSLFAFSLYPPCILGITAGVHRLWSHRAYKATWQLRIILMLFNTMAFQRSIIFWSKVHRMHHKYTDSDGDPHNSKRGLFFAHMGWVMLTRHPDIVKKEDGIDMSDLEADPILRFQDRFYWPLMLIVCFAFPTFVPMYFWNETFVNAFFVPGVLRYLFTLHITASINSFGHFYGYRPYEKTLMPAENNLISYITLGEGWHNFHHTFPWDYKASEWGNWGKNYTNAFIDFFAAIGWAYDLKVVSPEIVKARIQRTGDGSYEKYREEVWGWGDKDVTREEEKGTIIVNKQK